MTSDHRRAWWARTPTVLLLFLAAVVGVTAVWWGAATPGRATPVADAAAVAAAQVDCPADAQELPPEAVARAADAALKAAPSLYDPRTTEGVQVTASARATASERGGEVEVNCGVGVRERTVVVELLFPALLPSASLSQGVVWVSLVGDEYLVWNVAR